MADESLLQMFREESAERLQRIVDTLLSLERDDASADAVNTALRDLHSIKGAAGMLGLAAVGTIAHAMEDVLAAGRERAELPPEAVDPLLRATDALRDAVNGDDVNTGRTLAELAEAGARDARRATQSKAVTCQGGPAEPESQGRPTEPESQGRPAEPEDLGASDSGVEHRRTSSLRVDAAGLDKVVDTIGETVLHQRRLEELLQDPTEASPDEIDEVLHSADRRLDELQHAVIGLRTVPVSTIAGGLPRLVRDLGASAGKEVELSVTGADTRLDRVVLEGASEAISHLIRNTIAHGIEPPNEREAAGKPRRGQVEFRARQQGGRIAIEVADDGRGVAPELVARAGEGTPLAQVLAAPGLTQTERPTEMSGRGVGLDAVLDHVQRLGGEVEVQTEHGRGTTFTLHLPISLALLHVLLAERGGIQFGIPLPAVAEVVPAANPLVLRGRSSLEIRGDSVPLADPVAVLGGMPAQLSDSAQAVVAAAGGARAALGFDRVLGDEEVLVKPLGPLLTGVPGYLGAAVIGGGRIALVLDPVHVVPAAARTGARVERGVRELPAPGTPEEAASILVVDDQFTAREIQRSILEAAGYAVLTARDGREAWEMLQKGADIGLVVTDLEMPEMDGLELVRAIRKDPQQSSLPVVVVTSRGSEEDEREGLTAGADAYVVKQRFDQRALVDTVERLMKA